MLTKKDLKDISEIVTISIQTQVPQLIKNETIPIKAQLSAQDKKLTKVEKNTIEIINYLDRDLMRVTKRVDRLEANIHLSPI
jgi:hypothetical protein